MHGLVIAGSLVIEFVNQLMIYGNTLHESHSLNKILRLNKEHRGKPSFPLQGNCAIENWTVGCYYHFAWTVRARMDHEAD